MLRRIHPVAGAVGFLVIFVFWTTTAASEISGSREAILAVKKAIPWGFLILVPALMITGASGLWIAGGSTDPAIVRKKRRAPLVAAIGILILSPCASYLATLASRGQFDSVFYSIQAIELCAGAMNLTLMSLNIRDGLRLAGRLSRPQPAN